MREGLDFFGDDWKVAEDKPGYVVKTLVEKREDGSVKSVSTIYRPILTAEERERRMKLLGEAAAELVLSTLEAKARKAMAARNAKTSFSD